MSAEASRTLVFSRGGRLWGIDALGVRSVVVAPPVTRVPGSAGPLLGLVGWGGAAVPLLEPGPGVSTAARSVLVVQCDAGPLALAADEILGFDDYSGTVSLVDPGRLYGAATEAVRRAQRGASG